MATSTKKPTVTHVIDMFAGLNLPVTDDGQQIKAKRKELRDFYLRMSNDPDPQQRQRARVWSQNLTSLQAERGELLNIVRAHFTQSANTVLAVALSSGARTLTPEVHAQLERFAVEQCKCDAPLARRFVDEYLQEKGITIEGRIGIPRLVEQLSVVSSVGQVEIKWKLPEKECDEVIVMRFGTTRDGGGRELLRGNLSSYVDREVEPGQPYQYRVYSVWQGETSETGVPVEAVAIGEVSGIERRWVEDRVELSWQKPSDECEILAFRAPSPVAPVQRGVPDPLPHNPDAQMVFRGKETEWHDKEAMAGKEYHYLLVAFFEPGYFSNGVSTHILTPPRPPDVPSAQAEYVGDCVSIHWEPVPDEQVEYVVVRREGNAPPGQVRDGKVIETTADTHCVDDQIVGGYRYTYAVFAYAEGGYSCAGAVTSPVDILVKVVALSAETGDGTVELCWRTPENISRVIVRRGVTPPCDHTDGEPVKLTGTGNAKDEDLKNGQLYHYLVCCAYRPTGSVEVFSPGVRIEAVPVQLPELIRDFAVRVEEQEVVCTWTPPGYGQVVVIRSAKPHDLPVGQRLTVDEVDRLGERITAERGLARDAQHDINRPYYSVFTVAGQRAIAGGTGCAVVCPDVADLKLSATKDGIILNWRWPLRCTMVQVIRRLDAWPTGPDDPQATCISCTRSEYMAAGGKFVDAIQQGQGQFHYVVYARASGAPGQFFAPGVNPDCRAVIQWEPWMVLRYRLSPPVDGSHKGKAVRLTWSVENPFPDFDGFVLVASETRPPVSLDDGGEVFRWTPEKGQMAGDHEAWISLEPVQRRHWARFFCKAILTGMADRRPILVVHPNTCIPISNQGEIQATRRDKVGPVYCPRIPRTVICPYCFEEFPIEKMLFDAFDDSEEPRTARSARFYRLFGQPPRPPKTKQGKQLLRKRCPHEPEGELHVLPSTAGLQESLVIGIIGAKFSGKSHYIAALVDRLAGQVAFDFQAQLMPVTDETSKRYEREFHERLFERNLELPATVGSPPPLIYDLYLYGEQPRGVTLALYDTAGENLDDRETVRRTMRYLRIASGIIFLVDPLQSSAVREALPSSVPLPDSDMMAEPFEVINRVLTELENGKIVAEGGALSTPVAVVLTKSDVLRDTGLIDTNRLWSCDERHIGYFNAEIHDDMTGMMGEYVRRWSLKAYTTVTARFSRHAFFGVSSTGCASDKETHRYKYISPWRVEDPLLWLLAELGIISRQ